MAQPRELRLAAALGHEAPLAVEVSQDVEQQRRHSADYAAEVAPPQDLSVEAGVNQGKPEKVLPFDSAAHGVGGMTVG